MGRTKGTYTLTSNIEPKVGAPLDARTIVKLLADLTASNTFEYPYKGMKVFVEENNKSYTLVGSDPTVSTNWIEDNSGGHTIKNPAGTAMTQRSNLQFVDLTVSDDSTNDVTKVENIHVIQSESELDNLPDGLYMLNEDEGTVIDSDLVGYDNTDSGLEAGNVQDAIDEVVDALDNKIDISAKGVANGIAELDSTGKVPSSQLPSFVDDVLEYSSFSAFPATGETGKIYVALDTNKTYRWGGTEYVEISESLALGETSSTAYRGDRGKTAYDHSQLTSGNPHNVTKSEVGLGNVDNTSDSTKKTNFTGSIASGNTGFVTGGDAYTALGGKADKVSSATNGNLAGLNGSGNLTDSGWNGAKDTTSISGNPISISGLKANQLAINPIITFEPIQDLHGQSKPYPAGGGKNKYGSGDVSGTQNATVNLSIPAGTYTISAVCTSSDTDASTCLALVRYTDTTYHAGVQLQRTNRSSATLVLAKQAASITFYASDTNAHSSGDTFTVKSIQIEEGTQATDYAPYENICPISGYDKIEVLSCGVNVWNETWETGGIVWNTGQEIAATDRIRTGFVPAISEGTYYLYVLSSIIGLGYGVVFYNKSKERISSNSGIAANSTFTTPANTAYIRLVYIGITSYTSGISVNYPSTVRDYVPYDKTTDLSESLGQTVYGLTHDVRSGLCTDIWTKIDASTLSWGYNGTQKRYEADLPNAKSVGTGRSDKIVCSKYATDVNAAAGDSWKVFQSGRTVFVYDASQSGTPSGDIAYILANTTIQLTPHEISLLKDYAYVSTNGTNIALDYHNGELASLGDVSQLGETVNELGSRVPIIKSITRSTVVGQYASTVAFPEINRDINTLLEVRIHDGSKWIELRNQDADYAFWTSGLVITIPSASTSQQIMVRYI